MIILDTNVISEVMRDKTNQSVKGWFQQQSITDLYITSVTMAEVWYGLYRMPEGKRKQALLSRFQRILENIFKDSILAFDGTHTAIYAKIRSSKDSIGNPMSNPDAQIASIAKFNDALLATRNVKDFLDCGLTIVNPFEY